MSLGGQAAEAPEVHLIGRYGERVAGDALAKGLSQLRHLDRDDGLGGLRWFVLPQGLDQPVDRHVRAQMRREHALLLGSLDRDLGAAVAHLDRPQHADVHPARA